MEVGRNVICEENSISKSGIIEMNVEGSVQIAGGLDWNGGKLKVAGDFETLQNTLFHVDTDLRLEAKQITNMTKWDIGKELSLLVDEKCEFGEASSLEVPFFNGQIRDFLLPGTMQINEKTFKSAVDAIYINNGAWNSENLSLITNAIEQGDMGVINVSGKAQITAYQSSDNGFNGKIEIEKLSFRSLGPVECNANVTLSECQIVLLSQEQMPPAKFGILNEFSVQHNPMTVFTNNPITTEALKIHDSNAIHQIFGGLPISGNVVAPALWAEDVFVGVSSDAKLHLANNGQFATKMLHAGYLKTDENSEILLFCNEDIPQAVKIDGNWSHNGTLNFLSSTCTFTARNIISEGIIQRIGSDDLPNLEYIFENDFQNCTSLATRSLVVKGGRLFGNADLIEAQQSMKIVEIDDAVNFGVIKAKNSTISTFNLFSNNGEIHNKEYMKLTTKFIEQSDSGFIDVGKGILIIASAASEKGWNGAQDCESLKIIALDNLQCNAKIATSICEVELEKESSKFEIQNQFSVNNSPLTVTTKAAPVTLEDVEMKNAKLSGFSISGNLSAHALYAKDVGIKVTENAKIDLKTDQTLEAGKPLLMLHTGYLETNKNSEILLACKEDIPQFMNIETRWIHDGILNVSSSTCYFAADSIIKTGIIQGIDSDVLPNMVFKVKNVLYNYSPLATRSFCAIGGRIFGNNILIKAQENLEIVEYDDVYNYGTIDVENSIISVAILFANNGKIHARANMELTTKFIEQSVNGIIEVEGGIVIEASAASEKGWNGAQNCESLKIIALDNLVCNAKITTSICKIQLEKEKSKFEIQNDFKILNSPLIVTTNTPLTAEQLKFRNPNEEIMPSLIDFTISGGETSCHALYAQGVAVKLASKSQLILQTKEVSQENTNLVMLDVAYLKTESESTISASSPENSMMQFQFKSKWIHEGILEGANSAFLASGIINRGLIYTRSEVFKDMPETHFKTTEFFENHAAIYFDILYMNGTHALQNCGEIAATVIIANYSDIKNSGLLQATKICTLTYEASRNAILGGKVNVGEQLSIFAKSSKTLSLECTSSIGNGTAFKLPSTCLICEGSSLQVNTPIISSPENVTQFLIENKVVISEKACFSTVLFQNTNSENFVFEVKKEGSLAGKTVFFDTNCKEICLQFDGRINVGTLQFSKNVEKVVLMGSGEIFIDQIEMPHSKLELRTLPNFTVNRIKVSDFSLPSNYEMQLKSRNKESVTFIEIQNQFSIDGVLKLHNDLVIAPKPIAESSSESIIESSTTKQPSAESSSESTIETSTKSFGCINGLIKGVTKENQLFIGFESTQFDKLQISGEIDSMHYVNMNTQWLAIEGKLANIENAEIRSLGMVCTGSAENIKNMEINSFFVLSNNGQLKASKLKLFTPFFFNFHLGTEEMTTLGCLGEGEEETLLFVESIVFASGLSAIQANHIQNRSVLLFKFASLTQSTVLDHEHLALWYKTIEKLNPSEKSSEKSSEKNADDTKDDTKDDPKNDLKRLEKVFKELMGAKTDQDHPINLQIDTELYLSLQDISRKIKERGIEKFDDSQLTEALRKYLGRETGKFQKVLYDKLVGVREKAHQMFFSKVKKFKNFFEQMGFEGVPEIDENRRGIQEAGWYSNNVGGIIKASADGISQKFINSWQNSGYLESAGNIELFSEKIYQGKYGKMASICGSIFVEGGTADITNLGSAKEFWANVKKLDAEKIKATTAIVKADETIKMTGVNVKETCDLESKNADVDLGGKFKADILQVTAANNIDLAANGQANYDVGKLKIKSRRVTKVQQLLERTGVFADMKILDEFGLDAKDETIFLNSMSIAYNLDLKVKSAIAQGNIKSEKSVYVETSENLTMNHGSSIEAGKDIQLKQMGENFKFQMIAADLKASGNIGITAKGDIDILNNKWGTHVRQSNIHGENVYFNSDKKITMKASNIIGDENVNIVAKDDIVIIPEEVKTITTHYESCWIFWSRKTTTVETEVIRSRIKAGKKLNLKSEDGSINTLGAALIAEDQIHSAKKGKVDHRGYVTENTKNKDTSVLCFFNSNKSSRTKKVTASEIQGRLTMESKDNIRWQDPVHTHGDVYMKSNKVEISATPETQHSESNEWTIGICKWGKEYKSSMTQSISEKVGIDATNMKLECKESVVSGVNLNISDVLYLKGKDFRFEGKRLDSFENTKNLSIGIVPFSKSFGIDYNTSNQKASAYQNLQVNAGKLVCEDVENMELDGANMNCGKSEGTIKNVQISTQVSTEQKGNSQYGVGFTAFIPTSLNIGKGQSSKRNVINPAGFLMGETTMKIKKLKNKGGYSASNKRPEEAFEKIENSDIKEEFDQSNFSVNFEAGLSGGGAGFGTSKENKKSVVKAVNFQLEDTTGFDPNKIKGMRKVTSRSKSTSGFQLSVSKSGVKASVNGYGGGFDLKKNEYSVKAGDSEIGVNKKGIQSLQTKNVNLDLGRNKSIAFRNENVQIGVGWTTDDPGSVKSKPQLKPNAKTPAIPKDQNKSMKTETKDITESRASKNDDEISEKELSFKKDSISKSIAAFPHLLKPINEEEKLSPNFFEPISVPKCIFGNLNAPQSYQPLESSFLGDDLRQLAEPDRTLKMLLGQSRSNFKPEPHFVNMSNESASESTVEVPNLMQPIEKDEKLLPNGIFGDLQTLQSGLKIEPEPLLKFEQLSNMKNKSEAEPELSPYLKQLLTPASLPTNLAGGAQFPDSDLFRLPITPEAENMSKIMKQKHAARTIDEPDESTIKAENSENERSKNKALLKPGSQETRKGFDTIDKLTSDEFKALKENGHDFFIGRVHRSNGKVDEEGINNIKRANEAGLKCDAYMFPCPGSKTNSAKNQVKASLESLSTKNANIETFWLDIEKNENYPQHDWSKDKLANQKFISDMIEQAKAMGAKVGIYASRTHWIEIVGDDWKGASDLPLWEPKYDGKNNFDHFKEFGGWKKESLAIKQYQGNATEKIKVMQNGKIVEKTIVVDHNFKP